MAIGILLQNIVEQKIFQLLLQFNMDGYHIKRQKISIGNRKIKSAPYLSWNNNVKKYAEQHGVQNVIPIGSPFLYLHFYFKRKKKKKKK